MRNLLLSLVTLGAAFALGLASADAQTPPPAASVPAAPSDVQALGGVLTWTDNSDDEDGFRIVIRVQSSLGGPDTELRFEVGANVTSFVVPPEASIQCPDPTAVDFEVTAFNIAGESASGGFSIRILCPATPEPTQTPEAGPTALPVTGGGMGGGGVGAGSLLWTLVMTGAGLVLLGAGARWRAVKARS